MKDLRKWIYMALFIALEVILTRFLSIQTPVVRIGFTFLPIAISAIMFGPVFSGIGAAIADVLGMLLFPYGAYFPGFTLTAFLNGFIFGIFFYKKEPTLVRVILASVVATVICSLLLDTIWLYMILDKAIAILLPSRIIKALIIIPVQVVVIQIAWRYLATYLKKTNHLAQ